MPAMFFAIASGLCYNKTIHTEKGESPHAQYHRDYGFSRAGAGPLRPPDAEPAAQSAGTRKRHLHCREPQGDLPGTGCRLCVQTAIYLKKEFHSMKN